MQLGYFAMPLHPPGADYTEAIHEDLDTIVRIDELGFHEAWVGEHFTAEWEPIPAPELFIAMALARTKSIILGTGVTVLVNHNPFHLAHRIALLDHLAKGRFYWGVGSGANPLDFLAVGVDAASGEQREAMRVGVDMVLKLWDDPAPGVYESKWWRIEIGEPIEEVSLRVHMKPYQKPHPPIAVAGTSERSPTLIQAGERGWMPLSIGITQPWVLRKHWEAVEEGAQKAGRTPDRAQWRICREMYVADTTEQARAEVLQSTLARDYREYFITFLKLYDFTTVIKPDPSMPDEILTPEFLLDNGWIVGSPDDVEQQIRKLYDEVGGFGVLMPMAHEWKPWDKWDRSMTLLAEEVMPRLADLMPESPRAVAR